MVSDVQDLLHRRAGEIGDRIAGVVIERFGNDVPFAASDEVASIILRGIVASGVPLLRAGIDHRLVAEYRNAMQARVYQRLAAVGRAHRSAESMPASSNHH